MNAVDSACSIDIAIAEMQSHQALLDQALCSEGAAENENAALRGRNRFLRQLVASIVHQLGGEVRIDDIYTLDIGRDPTIATLRDEDKMQTVVRCL